MVGATLLAADADAFRRQLRVSLANVLRLHPRMYHALLADLVEHATGVYPRPESLCALDPEHRQQVVAYLVDGGTGPRPEGLDRLLEVNT